MKRVYVADLRPGDEVVDSFRVVEAHLAPYRDESKGHYLQLILADRSGQLEARIWDGAEDVAQWLAPGNVIRARARAILYRDRIRLRLDSVEPVDEAEAELADLVAAPVMDVDQGLATIHGAIDRITSEPLRRLLEGIYGDGDVLTALCQLPWERPGLLLARTVHLVELALPLLANPGPTDWPSEAIDGDLLLAAILVQDLGLIALAQDGLGQKAVDWLGRPALSDQFLTERLGQLAEFPADLALRLRHASLTADNPEATRTREAAVLAQLRQLQAALSAPADR